MGKIILGIMIAVIFALVNVSAYAPYGHRGLCVNYVPENCNGTCISTSVDNKRSAQLNLNNKHISQIKIGDTVTYDGAEHTVLSIQPLPGEPGKPGKYLVILKQTSP